ncbi:MAG: hypothetical protein JJE05_06490 [Actinobacteria bacterium]|nr:hypothetical protein [Actinomycetota bacterium]
MNIPMIRGALVTILLFAGGALFFLAQDSNAGNRSQKENPSGEQEVREIRADGNIVLEPPAPAMSPKVTGEQAAATALSYAAYATPDSTISKTFAIFTNTGWEALSSQDAESSQQSEGTLLFDRVPVWIVAFDKACVPQHGPALTDTEKTGCRNTEWNVVVNAETGEYIQAFSDR